ncbi:16S rRNA (uracil(1498)-N(3))-methyltransferase [Mucilaginibacter arboris]|uniref:Ribosomal RNA small subunit methyltransferase E n=1 Tax=Mucilaginibacter arboris TaxID=2682090 RepID=A0A7K1SS41_9SPHI|nr:16S rRNA (uracil(1498)-N(3))-methyltransferase [Mucilaginibacter arboris]MVN20064.1 16S rRNA (uracil(1498)-N(3))-methyltransferase [Mucilaginibacter arboris]
MYLFYAPDLNTADCFLNEEESRHCIKVLRLQKEDVIEVIDGKGNFYHAKITAPDPKKTRFVVLQTQQEFGKRNHYLHIAVAPTKNIERLEWFIEKATEIGIDEITPILCQRSERKIINHERLNKVITPAVKQSLKAYHPQLNPLTNLSSLLKDQTQAQKWIAHCNDGEKVSIKEVLIPQKKYLVLIGPEGDFSPPEINTALENGFQTITLGNSRLRTETAALEACFEVNFLNRL